MSVAASDIRIYLSANHAENDTTTQGGAIATTGAVLDDQFAASAVPEVVSDSASDTQNCTITGRLTTGAISSETKALNGTTPVAFSTTFDRILKVVLASAAVGSISIKQGVSGTTRHTMLAGETTARSLFYGAFASPAGGATKTRYEKVFIKNKHATDSALSLTAELTTDPRTDYDIVFEDAVDDNESVTNRVTAPTGIDGTFGDGPKACVNTDLDAGEAQGMWIRQELAAGETASIDEPVVTVAFATT